MDMGFGGSEPTSSVAMVDQEEVESAYLSATHNHYGHGYHNHEDRWKKVWVEFGSRVLRLKPCVDPFRIFWLVCMHDYLARSLATPCKRAGHRKYVIVNPQCSGLLIGRSPWYIGPFTQQKYRSVVHCRPWDTGPLGCVLRRPGKQEFVVEAESASSR